MVYTVIDYKLDAGVATITLNRPEVLNSMNGQMRAEILDALHGANIEIVSPTVMMTRARPADDVLIPGVHAAETAELSEEAAPEARIFDKAEKAESIESLRERRDEVEARLAALAGATSAEDLAQLEKLKHDSESLKSAIEESEKHISKER